ncbi:VF530 family DNA-binding protein [Chryseobacterium rhizosphaerae]
MNLIIIKCFADNSGIRFFLKFLKKTVWARIGIEIKK